MVIRDLHDPNLVIAIGIIDLQSHLYQFDGFESFNYIGVSLIADAEIMSKLFHEHFGHVNYRYLQQMST